MKLKIHHLALLGGVSLLGGCFGSDDNSTNSTDSGNGTKVYAVATDYSNYAVQSVESGAAAPFKDFANAPSGGGLALSSADGVLYIINQKTGELQAWKNSAIQFDVNVGAASNPYQVLKVGNKLYVVRWNCNSLLVLGASKGDSIGSLDLSKSANKEGVVNPAKAAFIGGKLWILAQRMFADYSYDSGMVIVADTGVATAPRGISLAAKDPQAIAAVGNNVYVASHGTWDTATADGGFDLFNAATGAWTKRLSAVAIGKPADLVAVAGNLWAIVYTDAFTTTKVVPVSSEGLQGAAVAGLAAANTLATDGSYLWVSDRAAGDKQAVWKLDGSTGAAISSVKTAYPPAALAIVQ